jgi:hypothetical protein
MPQHSAKTRDKADRKKNSDYWHIEGKPVQTETEVFKASGSENYQETVLPNNSKIKYWYSAIYYSHLFSIYTE